MDRCNSDGKTMRPSGGGGSILVVGVVLLVLCALPAQCLRCVSCTLNERRECKNGTEAAQNEQLLVTCHKSEPFCQVTQQERLLASGDVIILEIVRGCATKEEFSCSNRTGVPLRQCVSTCFEDLCNVYDNGAERVLNPEIHLRPDTATGLAWYWWLIIGTAISVLIGVTVAAVIRKRRKHTLVPSHDSKP